MKKFIAALLTLTCLFGCSSQTEEKEDTEKTEETTKDTSDTDATAKKYYKELKAWAEKYDTYTDDEKAKITDYEAKYKKLTVAQQEEIDTILKEKSGFTFNVLVVKAKSSNKTSSNSTTSTDTSSEEEDSKLAEAYQAYLDAEAQVEYYNSQLEAANQALQALNAVQSDYAEYQSITSDDSYSTENMQRAQSILNQYGGSTSGLDSALSAAQEAANAYDIDSINANLSAAQTALEEAANTYNSLAG